MAIPLPVNPLPGADVPGSVAEAQQANNDALATSIPTGAVTQAVGAKSVTIYGQFSFAYSIASVTTANFDVNVGVTLAGSAWQPFGAPNFSGPIPSWQEAISWAYCQNGATTVRFALRNNGSGTAAGTFYFFLLVAVL